MQALPRYISSCKAGRCGQDGAVSHLQLKTDLSLPPIELYRTLSHRGLHLQVLLEPLLRALVPLPLHEWQQLSRASPVVLLDPRLLLRGEEFPVDHARLDRDLRERGWRTGSHSGECWLHIRAQFGRTVRARPVGRREEGRAGFRTHGRQSLEAEPPAVAELPPSLHLLDDEDALEPDPERAFFVEARLVRGDVPRSEGRTCAVGSERRRESEWVRER